MDLNYSAEEQAFREEVREFFRTSVPAETRKKMLEGRHLGKEDMVNWQRPDSIIVCPIPENEPRYKKELPAHSLMPLYYSWKYFSFTHDTATMRYIYEPIKKYLNAASLLSRLYL